MEKPIEKIVISACEDCPLCEANTMDYGYRCKLMPLDKGIDESKKFQPITPKWCPLKQKDITIIFSKNENKIIKSN